MKTITEDVVQVSDLDREAIRAKYREEREKRIRPDGANQYIGVEGDFSHLTADPNAGAPKERAAIAKHVEVVIVGGGHCGLLAASELSKAGIDDFLIIDGAADFGGTWYWNRYPGLRCDIDSYIYMPLIEETGYMPTQKYASGHEIFENAKKIGEIYNLYDKALFQTNVETARWLEDERHWQVKTNRGDELTAQFVIMALGPLNRPKLPGVPGISKFKGHMFHTCRWDYNYTGGSGSEDFPKLEKLREKKVAILGTGCTGIQCAPRVAKYAEQLYVIQRTPSAIDDRNNHSTDEFWFKSQEPGWQKARTDNFERVLLGLPVEEDLVNDSWSRIGKILIELTSLAKDEPAKLGEARELADMWHMERIRHRVDQLVADPQVAEKLKAWYGMICKRPTFSDNYLPMFNKPNVSLLDTDGQGVEAVTENGVVVGGVEYEVDCLIFASGYEIGTDYCRRGNLQIYGKDGISLSEHWSEGMRTLYGMMSNGFPNCFHMGVYIQNSTQGNFTASYISQAKRIRAIIDTVKQEGQQAIELNPEGEAEWLLAMTNAGNVNFKYFNECTPGYYNGEGDPDPRKGIYAENYSGPKTEFDKRVDGWIEDGLPHTRMY
jgi:cyclohexanone monooxygenase